MRIRNIHPTFFVSDKLFDAEQESGQPVRLGLIGLWCVADREGRFEWNSRQLKALIFPYDTDVDFAAILEALVKAHSVVRYSVGEKQLGVIVNFTTYQYISGNEAKSQLPPPPNAIAPELLLDLSRQTPEDSRISVPTVDGGRKTVDEGRETKGEEPAPSAEAAAANETFPKTAQKPQAEQLATTLFVLLGKPQRHRNKLQAWTSQAERLLAELAEANVTFDQLVSALKWAFKGDESGFWPKRVFTMENLVKSAATIVEQHHRDLQPKEPRRKKLTMPKAESLHGGYVSDNPSL
jgi:hypothetical protein